MIELDLATVLHMSGLFVLALVGLWMWLIHFGWLR